MPHSKFPDTQTHPSLRELWRGLFSKKNRPDFQTVDASPRAKLFGADQLRRHAKALAGRHTVGGGRRADDLLARLDANEELLRGAYDLMAGAARKDRRIPPAAEWFLDNHHLIQEQVAAARRHLPKRYSRELPRLDAGPHAGRPRVYALALEFISHADGRIDAQGLRAFVAAYQSDAPLGLGELWAIPIMLRMALLENLRLVAVRIAVAMRDREWAARWAARMRESADAAPADMVQVLAKMARENPELSPLFVTEFAGCMQGMGPAMAFPLSWLGQRVAERGETLETTRHQASQNQASDQASIINIIGSLRFLGAADWRDFVEAMSSTEEILRSDPSGTYPLMDFASRDQYRHAVETVAKASLLDEEAVARLAVALAGKHAGTLADADGTAAERDRRNHVGHFLVGKGRPALEAAAGLRPSVGRRLARLGRRFPLPFYVGAILLLTALPTALGLRWLAGRDLPLSPPALAAAGLLLALCASQLAVALVHWAAMLAVRPRILPRLDFSTGIPPRHRAAVAVPAMLCDGREVDHLAETMEVRFLANRDPNLSFVLLTDFPDAPTETTPADAPLLRQTRDAIEALNARHGGGHFFLFHRARRWNAGENCWMGRERKRGKLEDFNRFLCGETGMFDAVVGDASRLEGVRYVIPLDGDTQLPHDAARKMVGAMAHPLNRPVYDPALGRVTEGYGILQPQVGIGMQSANRSSFARLFAGDPGMDPYTHAASDVYQDLFGEGSFVGKGIYDLETFQRALDRRLPDNRILSHDLLESGHARSGLLSDVVLFEDHPASHPAEMSRCLRWIRGDWQIASWLLPHVPAPGGTRAPNPLSALSRWKILDNLRRSLVPPALLAFLILGWFLPGTAVAGTLATAAVMLLPALCHALAQAARKPAEQPAWRQARAAGHALLRQALRQAFLLACLPHEAAMNLDAIGRAWVRMLVTRRHLLEWRTARDAQRASPTTPTQYCARMWGTPILACILWVALGCLRREAMPVAAPVLGLWLAAPAIAFRLGRTAKPERHRLPEADVAFLRMAARRTWRFFETFVGPEDHHLPPDNFQEKPMRGPMHRTSPTNIGMSLLATLAAHDFGFIPASEAAERTARTLDTLDKLERHRGHFYNWYDTRTLAPLDPPYVSTVDSGNLAGHLLVLAAGLEEMARPGKLRLPAVWAGLGATLDLALEAAHAPDSAPWMNLVPPLESLRKRLHTPPPAAAEAQLLLRKAAAAAARLTAVLDADADTDRELLWWARALEKQCRSADRDLDPSTPDQAKVQGAALRLLAARCRTLADAMEYGFLYNRERHLLSIGYNVGERRLDPGCYDLLASEARLASFTAIAQGKLPQENWFSLGRPVTLAGGGTMLLSWSGSMFEYLMPLLVMPTCRHTLLDTTYRAVVKSQIAYGRKRGVPWGVSECGYAKTDAQLNYQYRAFGVPGLGFQRGLADELVVAPYAGAMALMVDPEAACANLRRLAREGRLGPHGFYEAVDYTPAHLPRGQSSATVCSYMAHHQGMVFLSLAYVLLDRPMQRRFLADPAFKAAAMLLEERIPKTPAVFPNPGEASPAPEAPDRPSVDARAFATPDTPAPEAHLLSNGRYHVAVTAAGGGFSRWRDLAVTRWREDATRDCWGSFCYVRDVRSGEFWSAAAQPAAKRPDAFHAVFSQGRAELRRRDGDLETQVEIGVSPEDDIELRRISVKNTGGGPRTLELTSYAEVALAPPAADAAHPALGTLSFQTELARRHQAILCTRRPRCAGEKPPWMIHFMGVHGAVDAPASYETSRAAFIGRAGSPADPAAMRQARLSGTEGSVPDPVAAIRNTVTVGPGETVRVHLVTGAAESRADALALAEKYRDPHLADRVFELAWTHAKALLGHLDASVDDAQLYGRLAGSILYANPLMRAPGAVLARNRRGQTGLWAHGISGDLPIVLLRVGDGTHMPLARQLIQAHAFWRAHGLAADLVVLNEAPSGHRQALGEELAAAAAAMGSSALLDKPGGIFLRRFDQIPEEDRMLMQAAARVVVTGADGTLARQMDRPAAAAPTPPKLRPVRSRQPGAAPRERVPTPSGPATRDGVGGFTRDGSEYVVTTTAAAPAPAPWVNVIANPTFGTAVGESGGSHTWCENEHAFRLTPWNNGAACDACGEAFYVRDEETGWFWSPAPLPARGPAPYTTRHGFGHSTFESVQDGIGVRMRVHVAPDAPVKCVTLTLRNDSDRPRTLSATGFFELVLGDRREAHAPHVVTEVDAKTGALLARNAFNGEFSQRVAFLDTGEPARTLTGDRGEFIGRNGSAARPAGLARTRLSGKVGAGLDPCAAMQVALTLAPGQERAITFTFGCGRSLAETRQLAARFKDAGQTRPSLEDACRI